MRVNRLLSILLIIANKKQVTGQELADHFEVSLRTIYRDIDKISEAGVPIAATGGKGGGFYILDNYNLDNLFLDQNELSTVMPLLDNIRFMFGKNQHYNDIGLKFKNAFKKNQEDERLKINLSHFNMEEEIKDYLYLISKAIEEGKLLEFEYINRNMLHEKRVAEPIQISYSSGQWYVKAFCRMRNAYRTFKLVRIKNLKVGDSFTKRDISMEELSDILSSGYDEKSIDVKLKINAKMKGHINEHFRKSSIKQSTEEYLIIEEQYPHDEGLLKFILSLGDACEVLEPKYLREEMKRYLNKIHSIYKD